MIEKSPLAIWPNDRFAMPIRCWPVAQLCVYGRTLVGTVMLVARALVVIAKLHDRHKPVPVQHGHVVVIVRRRVPAQEVVVITADLAGGVVMADVVIVGLGQWDVHETENQNSESQAGRPSPEATPIKRHDLASFQNDPERLTTCTIEMSCPVSEVLPSLKHYEPASWTGQAAPTGDAVLAMLMFPGLRPVFSIVTALFR